ncbi:hypothetical protein GA0061099_102716 [Bradyrhizobium yuanmingense]|uniref:Uncharacterized protein n=1 Tax=Bradyrhizobium yuanmingense TaxID=108015 RepID=A0A1C3XJ98_9BRAD|nr:hypothetical protein [Bradyrhizobium yuanmingense]TWI17855.1 hypothetical protein IQ15_07323 [Bradyrhizobium yuanmingense]SCB52136.1 hypothetical protein GA0061099_102716 [Bradyrhizobium yuanmingense]
MNASRKKTGQAKKSKKSKPKKAQAVAAVQPLAGNPPTADAAADSGNERVREIISDLNVPSLHSDDITDILLHCASVLNLRNAIDNPNASLAHSSARYCYTKSGDDPTVSIWSGGFKVGETSEANAKASGIPPCG